MTDRDPRAELGEVPCGNGADAASSANDEDNLAVHGFVHFLDSLDGWFRKNRFAVWHDEPIAQRVPGGADAGRGRFALVMSAVVADQRARHPEHNVAFEVLVVIDEDLRDERFVPGLEAQEVDMSRTIGVPVLGAEHLTNRAVGRYRIAGGLDRSEGEASRGVGRELPPQVHVRLCVVLVFVETDRRGLPDVDLDVCERLTRGVDDLARDEQLGAGGWGANDGSSVLRPGRIGSPKRAEQRRG